MTFDLLERLAYAAKAVMWPIGLTTACFHESGIQTWAGVYAACLES